MFSFSQVFFVFVRLKFMECYVCTDSWKENDELHMGICSCTERYIHHRCLVEMIRRNEPQVPRCSVCLLPFKNVNVVRCVRHPKNWLFLCIFRWSGFVWALSFLCYLFHYIIHIMSRNKESGLEMFLSNGLLAINSALWYEVCKHVYRSYIKDQKTRRGYLYWCVRNSVGGSLIPII